MSNLARPSLSVHSLIALIFHLLQDSDTLHYLEIMAERSKEQCPVCNTIPLIAGHQDKEVYETCHVIRNANQARSIARDFLCLHKTTRDLSNRLTKCDKLGSCTYEDFSFLGCVSFQVFGLCEPPFWTILQLLHCLYLENFVKYFSTLSSFVENWRENNKHISPHVNIPVARIGSWS